MYSVYVQCICTVYMYSVYVQCICTVYMYSVYVQCICTVYMYSVYVQCVCTVCMYSVYVQCICTVYMYSVYVQCICTVCMYSVYVQCVCTVYMYSVYVQCVCTVYMYSVYVQCIIMYSVYVQCICTVCMYSVYVQQRLYSNAHPRNKNNLVRQFTNLMFLGKTKDAIRLLCEGDCGVPLSLEDTLPDGTSVMDTLESKHPPPQPLVPHAIVPPNPNSSDVSVHPVIFEAIDAQCIRRATLHTFGSAGPSGSDAACWKRLCTAFKKASNELCHAVALVARRLCSSYVDPSCISPLLACRLIPLNKNPGVRPIGVCETVRRIIAKAVLSITRLDILEACGSLQLCVGHSAGVEAAIHTMRSSFDDELTQGLLLVDASNAFNSLNRCVALQNINNICPVLATFSINCYHAPTDLFVGGRIIKSQEGTTQGDPLAMPLYGLSTVPLIMSLSSLQAKQVWYADDSAASGSLTDLHQWWLNVQELGPDFGYYVNTTKSWLIVKEEFKDTAKELFRDSKINITTSGRPYLGSPIGTSEFMSDFVGSKISLWMKTIKTLNDVALSSPHAAYAALTHGISSFWLFICRTTPNIAHLLQPLEDYLRNNLIPTLTGTDPPNDLVRKLYALPVRLGGLNIISPSSLSQEYHYSVSLSDPLISVLSGRSVFSSDIVDHMYSLKHSVHQKKRKELEAEMCQSVTIST